MPPPQKKKKPPPIRCDEMQNEKFSAPVEDVFNHNWWEVFCFPYILCGRFWDCFVSLCSGTNQCLVYWMLIQWIVCKITQITTPDAIIFPYYFYMFCQVILLTAVFVLIWIWLGRSVIIPYFIAFYDALTEKDLKHPQNQTRLAFRRYCFRKSEIFDNSLDSGSTLLRPSYIYLLTVITDYVINYMLN